MCSVTSVRVRPIILGATLIAMAMISPHLVDLAVRASHFPIAPFLFYGLFVHEVMLRCSFVANGPVLRGVVSGFLFLVVRVCEVRWNNENCGIICTTRTSATLDAATQSDR